MIRSTHSTMTKYGNKEQSPESDTFSCIAYVCHGESKLDELEGSQINLKGLGV